MTDSKRKVRVMVIDAITGDIEREIITPYNVKTREWINDRLFWWAYYHDKLLVLANPETPLKEL